MYVPTNNSSQVKIALTLIPETIPKDIAIRLRRWDEYFDELKELDDDDRSHRQLLKFCPAAKQLAQIVADIPESSFALASTNQPGQIRSTVQSTSRPALPIPRTPSAELPRVIPTPRTSRGTFAVSSDRAVAPAISSRSSKNASVHWQLPQSISASKDATSVRTSGRLSEKQRVHTSEVLSQKPSAQQSVQQSAPQPVQNFGRYPLIAFKSSLLAQLPVVDPTIVDVPQDVALRKHKGNLQEGAIYLHPVRLH